MMVVVMMVVVVMVMMMMVHLVAHRSGWRGFLRNGVSGKADGESGSGDKALDHGESFPVGERLKDLRQAFSLHSAAIRLNSE
jgi:hypothetical protein